tara:strand:- start:166 stop:1368 length:1203 start_codon:yes stop_codon:yes gene_type:complete
MFQYLALDGKELLAPKKIEGKILSGLLNNLADERNEDGQRYELDAITATRGFRGDYYVSSNKLMGVFDLDLDDSMVVVHLTPEKTQKIKMGKFLKKIGYPDKIVRDYSSKLRASIEMLKGAVVEFTKTSEEALSIYANGPDSCMAGSPSTAVYATDSVSVAYVKIGDRIVARSVVCTDPNIGLRYVCIYGNTDIMEPLLVAAGYEHGDLEGCRLKLIMDRDKIVCPYLDCGSRVSVSSDNKYLTIDQDGEHDAQSTLGYVEHCQCDDCGDPVDRDEERYCDFTDMTLCDDCFDSTHVTIGDTEYHLNSAEVVRLHDGEYVLEETATYVHSEDEWYLNSELTYSSYEDGLFLKNDLVSAITSVQKAEGELCLKNNCTSVNGRLIHLDIYDLYIQQLTLNLE